MIKRNVKKKYNILYVDAPWQYGNKEVKYRSEVEDMGAANQYDLMTLKELKKLPIPNLCEKDAVCFMWCVNPMLPEALELLDAWGFKYKTMLTWIKEKGSGYWFKGITEHIIFGVKGDIKAFRSNIPNVYKSKNSKHSRKPHYFRQLIKRVTKGMENPTYLELFARSREGFFPDEEYKNWDVWGNEVSNSINLKQYE